MLVEATPEWSDRILSFVSDSVIVMTEEFQLDDGTRSEGGLLREVGGVLHIGTDFAGGGGWPLRRSPRSCVLRILLEV